jgi:peptide/nickel transport system permease protein
VQFILRRIAFYVVAVWSAVTINFFLPRAMPGNPAEAMMAKFPHLSRSAYAALNAAFGVGRGGSLWHQYGTYLADLSHGNFGTDILEYPASVSSVLFAALPWTLILVGTATVISFLLGTGLGIVAAWRRGGWFERSLPILTFLQSTPYFFLALLAVDLLAIRFHLFPAEQGYSNGLVPGWNGAFIWSAAYHSVLPAFSIVATSVALWMLNMRNMMITTIAEDYVLAAQAKGLPSRRIIVSYAARNAILPSISAFAMSLGFVVSGALVMEIVFSYPGVGFLLYTAVTASDYPLIQAIFLIISLAVLAASFLADLIYVLIDPRSRTRSAR